MLHQQAHSLNTSTENLPPPPAYLLEARQTTPTTPPSAMPNSSQKVSETVKALSGLRHQPASPHTLRRLQQQQQQQQHHQQHQSMLQPPKQYQHQYTKSSPVLMSPQTPTSTTKRTTTPTPPTPLSPQNAVTALHQMDFDDIPPPLPPPNPNHHHPQLSLPLRYQQQLPTPNSNNNHMPSSQQMQKQHQQQHNHHHNQQQQQYHEQLQQLDYNNGEALYGTNSPTSFRTSSPGGGIYAQPKILNNMSSFRTNSPGPNGHQTPTTSSTTTQSHVPAQPKTNPNLIAQLNARLNSSKQQNTNEAIYGVTTVNHQQQQHHQREEIYMRNYQQQQQQQQQQHQQQQMSTHTSQPPQQLQQQQTYDDYTSTNVDKTTSIRSKAKAEFLENLNAKLAKQSLSGRAFAVRNLINSKALMYQNLQNLKRPSAQYRNLPLFDTNSTIISPSTTTTTTSSTTALSDEAL